jgi:hypothetical protein
MHKMDEHYHGPDEDKMERLREAEDTDRQSDQGTSDGASRRNGGKELEEAREDVGSSSHFFKPS